MKKRFVFLLIMLMCTGNLYGATYQYDDLNRVVKIIYDSGVIISYEYDSAGNITKVTNYNPEDDSDNESGNEGGDKPDGDNGSTGGGKPDGDNGSTGGGKPDGDNGSAGGGNLGGNSGAQDESSDIDGIIPEINEEENKDRKKLVLTLNSKIGYLDGEEINLTGSMFISKQNRLMLPIRQISYAIDVPSNKILWDSKNKIVTINGGKKVVVQVNNPYMIVDDEKVKLNEKAQIKEGRVYLPIADICTAFELKYQWDNIKKEIVIY